MNTVQPIKNPERVRAILEGLEHDSTWHGRRMFLLFATGIFTGLRISDIVKLKAGHVRGEYLRLREQKTGKHQSIALNPVLRDIYDKRLAGLTDDAFIFPSRKKDGDGNEKPISTRAAAYDMKVIAKRFGIKEPFACHSMRKTYGYRLYTGEGATLEELRIQFNHSKEAVTRRYIGVDEEMRNKHVKKMQYAGYVPEGFTGSTRKRDKDGGQVLETSWSNEGKKTDS